MNNDPESQEPNVLAEQRELNALFLQGLSAINPAPAQQESMRASLMQRITHSIAEHAGLQNVRRKDGVWQTLKTGIRFKLLWQGFEGNSVLIEFLPGATLPTHRHSFMEEGMVLSGRLQIGALDLGPYDYHAATPYSKHPRIQSKQGALAYLRGTSLGSNTEVLQELLGGIFPFKGKPATTILYQQPQAWMEVQPGVLKLILGQDAQRLSSFYRFAPGAKYPAHTHAQDEECMVLDGEVFLGDSLLKSGEYQLAPAGTAHGELMSDVGCLLFIREGKSG